MIFPALRQAIREVREGFGSDIITLGLKEISFTTENVGWYADNGYKQLYELLGGGAPAWSGETVTTQSALALSTVFACTRIISETLASLPLQFMQDRDGGRYEATEHPLYRLLHDEPNEESSDLEFRESLTAACVLQGNGFARILRRPNGSTLALYPILGTVKIDHDAENRLVYAVKEGNEQEKTYTVEANKPQEIFHLRGLGWDGVSGQSVIALARNSIGSAQAAEKYAAKFYSAGGRVPYVVEMAQRFRTEQDFQRWRADWNKFYADSTNWHQAVVMEPGMTYKQIGIAPEDAQFLETRQFSVPEICRWFRISPHLVGDLSRATFSNIEHLAIEFVTQTLMAWARRWEKAIWRCCLTPDEKNQSYYAKHVFAALLRGDFASRMAGYSTMLQNGIASINEVRNLEDWNPIDGGESHHIQLNMQTVPGTGEPTAAEQAALAKTKPEEPAEPPDDRSSKNATVVRDELGRVTGIRYGDPIVLSIDRDEHGRIAGVKRYGS